MCPCYEQTNKVFNFHTFNDVHNLFHIRIVSFQIIYLLKVVKNRDLLMSLVALSSISVLKVVSCFGVSFQDVLLVFKIVQSTACQQQESVYFYVAIIWKNLQWICVGSLVWCWLYCIVIFITISTYPFHRQERIER